MLVHLDSIICTSCHLSVHLGPGFNSLPTCSVYLGMSPMCRLSKRQCLIQPVGKANRRLRKQRHSHHELTVMATSSFSWQPALWRPSLPSAHRQVGSLLTGILGCCIIMSYLLCFRRPFFSNHWNLNVTSNARCVISPSSLWKKSQELSIICA